MRYVGLDLSLTRSGISVFNGQEHILTQSVKTSPKDSLQKRILDVLSIIETCVMGHEVTVFIEAHLTGKAMVGKAYDRAELAGVIKFRLYSLSIPFYMVHPKTLKKYVTGRGDGEKSPMLNVVATRMGYTPKNDDESDAHAICDFGYHVFHEDHPRRELLSYEKSVLAKWRKDNL
jgi:crossover junction endodeoxyribonuclease RuvC